MAGTTLERPITKDVEPLRQQVRGQVITAADDGYDAARAVHNGMFDKRPLAVLRAEQVADVIAAVNFARDNGLDLSVRDGGHSAPGFGTNDGGLVIDMSPMRTVRVDPRNKTARAGGGATWGDFNQATHAFGLATTGGIISTTGSHGPDAGRWHRLSHARGRPLDRQRDLGRRGHRGRQVRHVQRARERGPVLGAARRRRQLRRRDVARIPAARGRSGLRRTDLLQPGRRRRADPDVR